jgi:peptidoglycan/LPS O-acetylase OafA/YrhL
MALTDPEITTRSKSERYIPAIDGLRAISVIAVLLYHLTLPWWPGGFLGVDLFFVISGYVITRLILDSIERSSALDLRRFYRSRIRRLFPALIFMVVTTTLFIGVWAPETVKRFVSDLPFLFTGLMNWALVAREQDYFSTIGRPPLLQHTWSLAPLELFSSSIQSRSMRSLPPLSAMSTSEATPIASDSSSAQRLRCVGSHATSAPRSQRVRRTSSMVSVSQH